MPEATAGLWLRLSECAAAFLSSDGARRADCCKTTTLHPTLCRAAPGLTVPISQDVR